MESTYSGSLTRRSWKLTANIVVLSSARQRHHVKNVPCFSPNEGKEVQNVGTRLTNCNITICHTVIRKSIGLKPLLFLHLDFSVTSCCMESRKRGGEPFGQRLALKVLTLDTLLSKKTFSFAQAPCDHHR